MAFGSNILAWALVKSLDFFPFVSWQVCMGNHRGAGADK